MRLFFRSFVAVFLGFLFPFFCFGFSVTPPVADITLSSDGSLVTQVFSLTNSHEFSRDYTAKVQEVTFTSDGSIASFRDVSYDIGVSVEPESVAVPSRASQTFTVSFAHPDMITVSQVFALVLTEEGGAGQEVTDAFAALLFPQGVVTSAMPVFRIDAFTFFQDGEDVRAAARFTNTGEVLVRPVSIIVTENRFGHEIGRFAFVQDAGRLPVGTTRVVSDVISLDSLGFWHVGGDVTFTLLSIPDVGGEVQRATITFFTYPGLGVWIVGGAIFIFIIVVTVLLFRKKRGILRA
jgi:hypothetical protein